MQVAGKVVVVTGGAHGIGKALCGTFHRAGAAKVVVADLDGAGAETVAAGVDGAGFKCDVGREQDVLHLIQEVERQFGPIALVAPMPVSPQALIPFPITREGPRMITGKRAGRST